MTYIVTAVFLVLVNAAFSTQVVGLCKGSLRCDFHFGCCKWHADIHLSVISEATWRLCKVVTK